MPEITSETPRKDITIAEKTFQVPQPFTEGHVLSANEANALNQTYAENLRNNFASKVKEAVEAGTFDQDMLQSQLNDYADEYEFGVRTGGGGRSGDPVMAEALNITRELVRKNIQKQGKKVSDYSGAQITELAKGVLAKGDAVAQKIRATAEARVEAAKGLDIGIEVTPDAEPAKPRAKKGEAVSAA